MNKNLSSNRSRTKGLWSIIIRTTGEDFFLLRDAIYSVVAQSYPNKEIVLPYQPNPTLGHDHHKYFSERLSQLISAVRHMVKIRLISIDPDSGRTYPLQVAKTSANGEYLSFLDYDDIYYPYMGEDFIGRMEETETNFVYGNSVVVDQDVVIDTAVPLYYTTQKNKLYGEEFNRLKLLMDNFIPINTYIVKISEFEEVDFDINIDLAEDWDYLHSLIRYGKFQPEYVPINVSEYRKRNDEAQTHNSSLQSVWETSRERIYKKIADADYLISGEDINSIREGHAEQLGDLPNQLHELHLENGKQHQHINNLDYENKKQHQHILALGEEIRRLSEEKGDLESHVNALLSFVDKPFIKYPRKSVSMVKQLIKR